MTRHWLNRALCCAALIGGCEAADWTATIDLNEPTPRYVVTSGEIGATREALWLGDTEPVDPRTGAALSVHALPERLHVDDRSGSMRAISSRRGEIWSRPDEPQGVNTDEDLQGSIWSIRDAHFLTRIAADGAQVKRWSGADFGPATAQITSVQLSADRGGVLIVLRMPASNGATAEVVWLDANGRIQQRRPAPACTNDAHDDGASGFYAVCRNGAVSSIQRIAADPASGWIDPVTLPHIGAVHATRDHGVLVQRGISPSRYWRLLDAAGNTRFDRAGTFAAESGLGYWISNHATTPPQLVHIDAENRELGRALLTDNYLVDLVAHESGSAVIKTFAGFLGPYGKAVLNAQGQHLRRIGQDFVPGFQSRLRFASGLPFAISPTLPHRAFLIDAAGAPSSAPFPLEGNTYPQVFADARTLCTESATGFGDPNASEREIRCFERTSGAPLGRFIAHASITDLALLGVGSYVSILERDNIVIHSRDGTRLREIPIARRSFRAQHDFDAVHGTVVWHQTNDGQTRLRRYRDDGELVVDAPIALADATSAWGIFLMPDGSVFVFLYGPQPKLNRYSSTGELVGSMALGSNDDIAGVHATSAGVQVVLKPFGSTDPTPVRVRILSPALDAVRAEHALGAVDRVGLWPTDAGEPIIATSGPRTLALRSFDSSSGEPRVKAVLATRSSVEVAPEAANGFAIDASATVQLLEFDAELDRDVLRVHAFTSTSFSGRMRQTALAGSWYAPSSTGQGLIVELLNDATQLFAAWHTYAPAGGNALAQQQWLTVQGDVGAQRGAITLPIYRNSGGRFDVSGRTNALPVGEGELVFTSCDRMEFWYRIGNEAGALPLQRLTPRTQPCDDGTQLEPANDTAPTIDLGGPWYDPSRSGQGLAVSASGARFNQFFAGWFTYDADAADDTDAQHWFTLQGANPTSYGQPVSASIFRTTGGSRSGEPTRNTHRVGVAQLTVHDCANATLEYVFDDSAVAGAFADRMRAVPLKRLGQCTN